MNDDEVAELSRMAGTDFTGFAKTNRVSMKETLSWFEQYLTAHPEVELVYRRRPSEWNSPALEELARKCPNFHVIFADSVKQWIVAADSISIWMSTAIAEVYMAGKSCHILRPVPIEHEYDPVIYKDARYITTYADFAAASVQQDDPPFPIAREVIEGYFDPSETPAYARMADLLEDVYKNSPRDEPMGEGFTPHFNLLKFCALAGVHFLYRRGWEPKKVFAVCPPLANFAQRIYGYVDKAHVTPEQVEAMTARIAALREISIKVSSLPSFQRRRERTSNHAREKIRRGILCRQRNEILGGDLPGFCYHRPGAHRQGPAACRGAGRAGHLYDLHRHRHEPWHPGPGPDPAALLP